MAKQQQPEETAPKARYEFRVWGKHRKARKILAKIATDVTDEKFDDCYLLVDDPSWNAKVRDNTLKIKQLVTEKKGFEQWTWERPLTSDDAPSPFDDLFDQMNLDRPQRGKSYNLPKQVKNLDPADGVRAIFVTKQRRRYRYGTLRAEVTDIKVHDTGKTLRTLSIEGDDVKELSALRKQLGIRDEPNIAMHQYIEDSMPPEDSDNSGGASKKSKK